MLHGVFRTKEGKVLAAVLTLTVIIAGVIIYNNYKAENQYKEQTVMAEKYLNEGNYDQAVGAYLKALSMKDGDQEKLTIGLAEAYVGNKDFDKALEVLRTCFQKTSENEVKEKIEEVTSQKTDYEYLQIISRADNYFDNKEYSKAITEYEKAKQIKSKEVTSYQRIAEAYLETGDYDKALEEAKEGLALTQSDELSQTLDIINAHIKKQQYDKMVSDAAEYIAQENYEDGINKYREAIQLIPEEEHAYSGLAGVYLDLKEFQKAADILNKALEKVRSDKLQSLLDEANGYLAEIEARNKILSGLYDAVNRIDINKIIELTGTEVFKDKIAADFPVFYSLKGEGDIVNGSGMIIYDSYDIYCGQIKDGIKKGKGIYINLTPQYGKTGCYYYQGTWNNNIPNGAGTVTEITEDINEDGETVYKKTVTEGTFFKGLENGSMHKYFSINDKQTGDVTYSAISGEPLPMTDENGQPLPVEEGKPYAIGLLFQNGNPTTDYYTVEPLTLWGVKPFINK